jgi:hypothetical protein
MCCLVVVAAFLGPRVALVATWLFTERTSIAFDSFWYGAAGFIFLPWTTVLYAWTYQLGAGVQGFGWVLVIFGFVIDVSTWFGGARRQHA